MPKLNQLQHSTKIKRHLKDKLVHGS